MTSSRLSQIPKGERRNLGGVSIQGNKDRLDQGGFDNSLDRLTEPAMKEFLHFLTQQLVSNPGEVEVRETAGGLVSILELRVAKEDIGRVTERITRP